MTLGQALAAKVRLMVWCMGCGHRAEPDIAEQADSYGADVAVIGRRGCGARCAMAGRWISSSAERCGRPICVERDTSGTLIARCYL